LEFCVEDSQDVKVVIEEQRLVFSCKNADGVEFYNEINLYARVNSKDSQEKRSDRSITCFIRKWKEKVAWPRITKENIKLLQKVTDKGPPPAMDDLDVSRANGPLPPRKKATAAPASGLARPGPACSSSSCFPGAPDDRGLIGDVPVLRVSRRGAEAVHFVRTALEPGAQVLLSLDWERRFDHMQQHSGTATVADVLRLCRELGRQRSVIELDTPSMTAEQIEALERSVNEKIRERVPVTVRELAADDPEVETVRSRGLPDDHTGPVRVVSIEGIDSNMCCGTHVSNLSDLQVIKLLGTEKGKKNKTNLVFLAGNRVLKSIEQSHSTEKALTSLLKNGPGEHVEAVKRLQSSVKLLQKMGFLPLPEVTFYPYRKEGDSEFMNIIANEIGTEETLLFLTVGDEKEAGLFLLAGPVEAVENLGPRVAELLGGKGAGKRGRFQGKATKMSQRGEVQALLQEFISRQSPEV
uniref:CS domain-containing protein n=1 Tax=Apteryx owenii TaxID=8824 RepID=A0A8B9PE05_APTOW